MNQLFFDIGSNSIFDLKIGAVCSIKNIQLGSDRKGFNLYFSEKKLLGFFICFCDGYRGFNSFSGDILWMGERKKIDKNTTDKQLEVIYKSLPIKDWNDGVERNLEFSVNGVNHEYNWNSLTGELNYLLCEI